MVAVGRDRVRPVERVREPLDHPYEGSVDSLSSVMEKPRRLATQTCVPSVAIASGKLNSNVDARSTLLSEPSPSLISVTDAPFSFVTQTCAPSEAIASGD